MGDNNSIKSRTFDAIVVGSGISGGWAAKELTEHGVRTLLLERGRDVKHIKDYPTANKYPWEFEHRMEMPLAVREANPIVSRCYAFKEDAAHFLVRDNEHPYVQEKPFDWIKGYQVGGKSLLWARQTQRWSDYDFTGPVRDGFAVDWPIRYAEIAPWYSHVEKFAGITGNRDGLPQLPDGEFLPAMEMTCVDKYFQDVVKQHYKDRHVIYARHANISEAQPIHTQQGRATCQRKSMCERGCPFGGYFSSNASTIPWAERTGNLTLRPFSVVHSVIYDEAKGRATGVRVVDAHTKEMVEYYARVIFINGGTLNTNLLLLNSTSRRHPNGLGNDSGVLGKYVAFHNYRTFITADYDGFKDSATDGRKPTNAYMPRFRNVFRQETDFLRGYAVSLQTSRPFLRQHEGFGEQLKRQLDGKEYGPWKVRGGIMAETIPKETNLVHLSKDKKDDWGVPLLHISVAYDDNDEKIIKDFQEQMSEMFTTAGFTNLHVEDSHKAPGLDIHEMGGARMGHDPKTSMLNKWNQLHACPNVIVTDGACMTSTSTQNPSLTYMALTARAVDHVLGEMKKGNI